MIETVLATVALGLLSGCPSTIPSNSIDIPQPNIKGKTKTKTKQTKKKNPKTLYKCVFFFPEGSRYTRKCSMYILHWRGMKEVCKRATRGGTQRSDLGAEDSLRCSASWNVGTHTAIPSSRTQNTDLYYGTLHEIKSFPKTS